ncbi:hypothetical protein ABPG72_014013 [Tetrahymena utriculariae]
MEIEYEGDNNLFIKITSDDYYQYLSQIKHTEDYFITFEQYQQEQRKVFQQYQEKQEFDLTQQHIKEQDKQKKQEKSLLDSLQQNLKEEIEIRLILQQKEKEIIELQGKLKEVLKQREEFQKNGILSLNAKTQQQKETIYKLIEIMATKPKYNQRRQSSQEEKKFIIDSISIIVQKQIEQICELHRNTIPKWQEQIVNSPQKKVDLQLHNSLKKNYYKLQLMGEIKK